MPWAGVPNFRLHYRVAKEVEARRGHCLVGLVSFQWPVTTPRRTWRRADVVAQRPSALFHFIPAPQAWRTCVIKPSSWWSGASGIAWAEVATVNANATAINLIISHLPYEPSKKDVLEKRAPSRQLLSILPFARCCA